MGKIYSIIIILSLVTGGKNGLTGDWEHGRSGSYFGISLNQKNTSITGSHTSVEENGDRIDAAFEREITIRGKLNEVGVATVSFTSAYCNKSGRATIRRISSTQIEWKIITPPNGDYYIPNIDTLTREK